MVGMLHGRKKIVAIYFLFCRTTTATTMAMMMRITMQRMKQIQRFLRADRAESTAFEV